MNITLTRAIFNATCTIGKLKIPSAEFECYVLEDFDRDLYQQTPLHDIVRAKVFGATCIPYGTYEVAITWSNRFKRLMPQIMEVPGFSGIRIHSGNTAEDTEGCLLPGTEFKEDSVRFSRVAYANLFPIMQDACSKEKVFLTISKFVIT